MLLEKLVRTNEKFGMFSPGDTVIVAVSGGVDSVVLLHALYMLKDQLGIHLHVAHVNHGIRGQDADDDAKFVQDFASSLDLPCAIGTFDVPALQKQWKVGTEEAARRVRYQFLNDLAERVEANKIATAHTASDQAETVLMNLLRGSGIEGLGAIPPIRDRIIRPLIETTRAEVEEYAGEHKLKHREDATNRELTYTRNRIRHQLLPAMRDYNPKVDDALARLAETARSDNEVVEQIARQTYLELAQKKDGEICFPLPRFIALQKAIQRRLIRSAVEELSGSLADIGFIHVENLLAKVSGHGVYEVELPPGTARARKTPDTLSVYLIKPEEEAPKVRPMTLDIPGEVEMPELDLTLRAESLTGRVDWRRPRESMDVVIDAEKIEGTLIVRTWLPGDRIILLGMDQPKKLQDLFTDRKIPKGERSRIPLVVDEEKILWVAGVTISQEAAVTPETTGFLSLRVIAQKPNKQEIDKG